MSSLEGRKALVLGAGNAAGGAIARALAGAGADVAVASASLDGAEVMAVRRVRRAVEAHGRRSVEYSFDVTLGANVQVSTRQVAKDLGGLDILVYAVDAPLMKPAATTTDADWARVLATNLSGAFYACRATVREMTPGGWGRIVLVVPDAGQTERAGVSAYTAARAGLAGLARALGTELAEAGIRVYAIVPAWLAGTAGATPADELLARTGATTPATDTVARLALVLTAGDITGPSGQVYAVESPAPPA